MVIDDLFERRVFEPGLAYGQSKSAVALFAVEATRRWAEARAQGCEAEEAGLFRVKTPEHGAADAPGRTAVPRRLP